jgi:pimeloyl-ACP methyl ester carboxylesterase
MAKTGTTKLISSRRGPPLRNASGSRIKTGPESLVALESIELGGATQWISIRGRDRKAPILLYLHGGPGSPETPIVRRYFAGAIEENFLVVAWEQRGAGKSFMAAHGLDLNVELFLSDTLALVDWLRSRFGQEKVYILGHSWGSLLGILFAQAHPERVAAYGGVGQYVGGKDNERESWRWTLAQAKAKKLKRAVRDLEAISWYGDDPLGGDWLKAIKAERRWLLALGGGIGHDRRFVLGFARSHLLAPEYTLVDKLRFFRGSNLCLRQVWEEVMGIDLRTRLPRLEVPAYFFLGRWDWTTPSTLAEDWARSLEAPKKDVVWFENSAHSPCFEEAARFAPALLRLFLGKE